MDKHTINAGELGTLTVSTTPDGRGDYSRQQIIEAIRDVFLEYAHNGATWTGIGDGGELFIDGIG